MSDTGGVFDGLHLRSLGCMGGASCLQCVGHFGNAPCMGPVSWKMNVTSVICTRGILENYFDVDSSQFVMLEGCIMDDYLDTFWKCGAHDWDVGPFFGHVICVIMSDYLDTF